MLPDQFHPDFDRFFYVDFHNWRPVDVSACKDRPNGTPVRGWMVSLTKENVTIDTQPTGDDGCHKWSDLEPGVSYDVHEAVRAGWAATGPVDFVFDRAQSHDSFSHTFVNEPLQGCTPGFWQGGNDFGTAGGRWLWNEVNDPDWPASGGAGSNPYIWTTGFCGFFGCSGGEDMWYYVNPELWNVNDDFHKAARSLVAAYLNASWGMGYAYSTDELKDLWADALSSGGLLALHDALDAANNAKLGCPISASR